MRENFAQAEGRRGTFTATFKRFGEKRGFKGWLVKTVLLIGVSDTSGKITADHIWFTCGKQFKEAALVEGDRVQFVGRITTYEKGYKGSREWDDEMPTVSTDYRISFPTQVKNLSRNKFIAANTELPLFQNEQSKKNQDASRL